MNYHLQLFSGNLKSLLSIYFDSEIIRKQKAKELEENIMSWSDEEFDYFSHYSYHFEWLLLQSLFISGFSYLESFMRSTALTIERNEKSIKISDIKGSGNIDTYRKYIHLIGKIDSANSDRKEWQIINEFKTIRNSLVHENGQIKKKLKKIEEHNIYFGESESLIRIKNVKFLEDFCETSIKYMESIVCELNKKNYVC